MLFRSENHIMVFFTGMMRPASSVLTEQKANTANKLETLKEMADAVLKFKDLLMAGNFEELGKLLHDNWLKKKRLASGISNSVIDDLYQSGIDSGAWGGKVLGAGGGGCLMFLVEPSKKDVVREGVKKSAEKNNLGYFNEIPVKFVQSGVEIILNTDNGENNYQ